MNTLPTNDKTQRTLDALLSRAPAAVVPADFTRKTLARIRQEAAQIDTRQDGQLDAWLASQPLAPSETFTEQTVRRIRQLARRRTVFVKFPLWASSLAAALAIGLFLTVGGTDTAHAPASVPAQNAELSVYEFAEMAQLLSPVAHAESFFDESNITAISVVSALTL